MIIPTIVAPRNMSKACSRKRGAFFVEATIGSAGGFSVTEMESRGVCSCILIFLGTAILGKGVRRNGTKYNVVQTVDSVQNKTKKQIVHAKTVARAHPRLRAAMQPAH
jgi:hypothetical protein